MDDSKLHAVYVSNLPLDITEEEFQVGRGEVQILVGIDVEMWRYTVRCAHK